MSSQPSTAVIIPVHGQLDLLDKCLQSLERSNKKSYYETWLVDDGTPGGLGSVPDRFRVAKVITRKESGGFSAAINDGFRALTPNIENVILLNSDMEVLPGWLDALVDRRSKSMYVGIVAGMEIDSTNPDRIVFGGSRPVYADGKITDMHLLDRRGSLKAGHWQDPERLEWASFGFVLITRDTINTIGLLDERFENYFSDVDYCMRANQAGIEVWYEPDARVLHKRHASTGLKIGKGLLGLQHDREKYFLKWNISQYGLPVRQRHWMNWLMNDRSFWRTTIIPHLEPNSPLSTEGIMGLFDEIIRKSIDEIRNNEHDPNDRRKITQLWWQLYSQGLAFVETREPRGTTRSGPPFLDGVNVEVISPHCDDAAFSIGGLLLDRSQGSSYTTIHTLFGLTNYARDPWVNLSPDLIREVRTFEEAAYCSHIGANYLISEFPDRLVRLPNEPILLSDLSDLEDDIVPELMTRLLKVAERSSNSVLFVPLAADLMADHALIAVATTMIMRHGFPTSRVLVYDDLPYANSPLAVQRGRDLYQQLGFELTPHVFDISRWFEAKREFLSIYASQIDTSIIQIVENHSLHLAKAALGLQAEPWRRCERLWTIKRGQQ